MNSSVSIGTEQLSETSVDQQTGGFLFGIFGEKSGYGAELCLRAFNGGASHIACYVIKDSISEKINGKNFELDYSKKDKDQKTILHHLVIFCAKTPEAIQLLLEVLDNTSAKKYINIQDSRGNTCAHYANYASIKGYNHMSNVVLMLQKYGVNLAIKNNDGLYIELEKKPIKSSPNRMFLTINSDSCGVEKEKPHGKQTFSDRSVIEDKIQQLVKAFVVKANALSEDTIGFNKNANTIENDDDEDDSSSSSIGGMDSHDILKELMGKIQAGGAKKKTTKKNVSGRRKMNVYSEVSFGGSSDDDDNHEEDDSSESSGDFENRLARLARAVNNKASEAHANAIIKIKEILGLDDEEARAVKAMLYEKVKKEHPEYSNADKAMELEKMASDKAVLKEIKKTDIKKMVDLIKQKHASKNSDSQSASSNSPLPKRQARHLPNESGYLGFTDLDDDSSSSSSSSSNSSNDSSSGLDSATVQ
jgi:hypothetical protein